MRRSMLIVMFALTYFWPIYAFANETCVAYESEAEAFSGVVPKFNEDGSLRALLMYGEGTFLTSKRSLISDARRKAELRARQAYAEFLKSDFDSQTLAKDLVETSQATSQDGQIVGDATELSSTLTQIRNNATATLNGIVKLDECVDVDQKYVAVTLGWKPSMSRAAAAANTQMNAPAPAGGVAKAPGRGSGAAVAKEQTGNSKVAGVELITLETSGVGVNLRSATNEALKLAVSQVFGEQFASQSKVVDSVDSLSANLAGYDVGAVVEQSSSQNSVQSSTSGVIRAWSYLEKNVVSGEHRVVLSVTVPKYQSAIDSFKSTMIVVPPSPGSGVHASDQVFKAFADLLRSELETVMNATAKVTVLDRAYTSIADGELANIQSSGNVAEMAKLGNKVGADLMLVPVVEQFKYELDKRQVGEQMIERMVFNVTVSTKVIEVATTNLIDSRRFPQRNKRFRTDSSTEEMALFMASQLGRHLSRKVGGSDASAISSAFESQPDVKGLVKEVDEQFEEMKADVQNDW